MAEDVNVHYAVYWRLKRLKYWWVVPELNYESWFGDFIGATGKGKIIEVEIKHSWSDYQADKWKSKPRRHWWSVEKQIIERGINHKKRIGPSDKPVPDLTKWEFLKGDFPCRWRPNYFVIAAPGDLADKIMTDPELPKGFGVWGVEPTLGSRGPQDCIVRVLRRTPRLAKTRPHWMAEYQKAMAKRCCSLLDAQYLKQAQKGEEQKK